MNYWCLFWLLFGLYLIVVFVAAIITFVGYSQGGLAWLWFTLVAVGIAIIWIPLYWCVYVKQAQMRKQKEGYDIIIAVPGSTANKSKRTAQQEQAVADYKQLQQEAKNNPSECRTERDLCREQALRKKFQNDKLRGDVDLLEKLVAQNPDDDSLNEQLRKARKDIAADLKVVSQCDTLSDSNACTERLVEACDKALRSIAPEAVEQFQDLRQSQSTENVIGFCKGAIF